MSHMPRMIAWIPPQRSPLHEGAETESAGVVATALEMPQRSPLHEGAET